jgi:hypothetical protein
MRSEGAGGGGGPVEAVVSAVIPCLDEEEAIFGVVKRSESDAEQITRATASRR